MTENDRRCEEARKRLADWIARSCAQHLRRMREGWK